MSRPALSNSTPGAEEYVALRAACSLGPRTIEAARIGLPASLFAVTLRSGDRLIGMGRIVGDGGCFAQVVDVAVHPDHQGHGYGKMIVDMLLAWARRELPPTCYLSLIANPAAETLYARAGFGVELGMGQHIP